MIGKFSRLTGAIGLISGTTIGAAMLALPITSGLSGFFPALILMTVIWLFMMLTAFYFLEVNLRMRHEANLITMMKRTLGKRGELFAWIIYLLLLYALIAAYIVGCSQIASDFICSIAGKEFPQALFSLLIFILFGSFLCFGVHISDLFNRFLMLGLILAYLLLVDVGLPHIHLSLLNSIHWSYAPLSLSVIATSFGYHIIIPTLAGYLDYDKKLLVKAIVIGSIIPFLFYLLFELLVLGIIPIEGEMSLRSASEKGLQATLYLKEIIGSPLVTIAARAFAFFAIVTSLLGVSLSLSDFLADGLKIKKTVGGKLLLALLVFLPPLFFALFYPQGFLFALKLAGIFVVLLLALLPSLMVWFERYGHQSKEGYLPSHFRMWGGKSMILFSIFFSLFLLILEVFA